MRDWVGTQLAKADADGDSCLDFDEFVPVYNNVVRTFGLHRCNELRLGQPPPLSVPLLLDPPSQLEGDSSSDGASDCEEELDNAAGSRDGEEHMTKEAVSPLLACIDEHMHSLTQQQPASTHI